MLKLGSCEKLALFIKVCENEGVSVFNEFACVGSFLGHLALTVNELNEGKVVVSSNA